MSIVLEIQDGPPPSYLTSKIRVRATPNASDPEISPVENTTNYLFVEVKNNGTEDATGCVCNTTGPFVAPQVIAPSGEAGFDITTKAVTLAPGPTSLLGEKGTSIVIHADRDDEKTDPAGNSGARVACGAITK